MIHVHVLAGDNYSERDVSLRSGSAVADALRAKDYEVTVLDPSTATIDQIAACDVVFPALHGKGGEDGVIQGQLEAFGVPCVGSDAAASALCFDKWAYRQHVTSQGLPMPAASIVQADTYRTDILATQPYVLKPIDGGSSIDTYIVRDPAEAPHEQIAETFTRYPSLLMEQLIVGTELTVGVLETAALPVIEIIPPSGGEFDYENKYNGATQELCPPLHVSNEVQQAAQALALRTHTSTGCRDLSRTDIMCDETGKLYLLETNTLPGMTDQSLFPKMAATAGLPMQELCDKLVKLALSR
jgi:D-alanine-D-alanine ligase